MSEDKIKFYEQVLELEPGSKLFFVLAKLHHEQGRLSKARQVLESGLEKHPDHIQAKLLLATILKHQQESEAAQKIYLEVFNLFSYYPEFWEGVATELNRQGHFDPALAASFLSSWTKDSSLSWSRIFQAGLQSLVQDQPGSDQSPPEEQENPPENEGQDIIPEKPQFTEDEQVEHQSLMEAEPDPGLQESREPAPETGPELADPDQDEDLLQEDISQARGGKDAHGAHEDQVPEGTASYTQEPDQELDLPQQHPQEETAPESREQDPSNEAGYEEPEEVPEIDFEDEARTKSMASLLVAQEEYQKALDIYRELWIKSLPGTERRELESTMSWLQEKIASGDDSGEQASQETSQGEPGGSAPEKDGSSRDLEADADQQEQEAAPAGKAAASDKEEVVDFLSRLAERLESKK